MGSLEKWQALRPEIREQRAEEWFNRDDSESRRSRAITYNLLSRILQEHITPVSLIAAISFFVLQAVPYKLSVGCNSQTSSLTALNASTSGIGVDHRYQNNSGITATLKYTPTSSDDPYRKQSGGPNTLCLLAAGLSSLISLASVGAARQLSYRAAELEQG